MAENSIAQNKSGLKDFIGSIATMSGDLSNITAPPFILDTKSTVEIPSYWAQSPPTFCAAASADDPARRALLVLRSFLSGVNSQSYLGHSPEVGPKKPLNSFLGELFFARWDDDQHGPTYMASEQVGHHPPITACCMWNEKSGVSVQGYNRSAIGFNGSVNVESMGHGLKTIEKYNEHYLLPIPDLKFKGILTGAPYPESSGTYYIPSTSGYMSVVHFGGSSFFSSTKKHSFTAHVYRQEDGEKNPVYTAEGTWDEEFVIKDCGTDKVIETFDMKAFTKNLPEMVVEPIEQQDPWESRRAWHDVIQAVNQGNMKGVSQAKNRLEEGQRAMREEEQKQGKSWESIFFKQSERDQAIEKLFEMIPGESFRSVHADTSGVWKFDFEKYKSAQKPYHSPNKPDNTPYDESGKTQSSKEPTATAAASGSNPTNGDVDHKADVAETSASMKADDVQPEVDRQPERKETKDIAKDQPDPQAAQQLSREEEFGSGIDGMSLQEKKNIEDALRDKYSTAKRH